MAKTPAPLPKAPKPADRPHLERGDEIYFQHKGEPYLGKVLSHGEHGCTVELNGGGRHKVRWEGVVGHKRRMQPELSIVDQGEDGFVARDQRSGRLRYIADPLDEAEGEADTMAKSFLPADPIDRILALRIDHETPLDKALKNGPGLSLQSVTTKTGVQTKRWKRNGEAPKKERKPAAPKAGGGQPAASGPPPGHHDAKEGQSVSFKAGDFHGKGKIYGKPGPNGAHVMDSSGRVHQVRWDEIHEREGKAVAKEPRLVVSNGKPAKSGAAGGGDEPPIDTSKPFFPESAQKLPRKAQQPWNTWEELEAHAQEAHAEFGKILSGVGAKLGLRTDLNSPDDLKDDHIENADGYLFMGPIKKKDRAQRKVDGEYEGDWNKVTDIVRATISVATFADVHKAVAAVEAAGLHLAQRPKDKFAEPTHAGYRDLMTIVKLPNGMLAELQYHLKPITAAKAEHHHDYAEMGKLQTKYGEEAPSSAWSDEDHAAFHHFVGRQKKGYGAAWRKAGGTD